MRNVEFLENHFTFEYFKYKVASHSVSIVTYKMTSTRNIM